MSAPKRPQACGTPAARNRGYERVEQARARLGRRGAREARSKPAARIRGQRELRNEQQRAADVAHGPIHLAGRIGKHAIGYEARSEPFGLFLAVFDVYYRLKRAIQPNFGDFYRLLASRLAPLTR
jgi:hypothetical protein